MNVKNKKNIEGIDLEQEGMYPDLSETASYGECTGLMPTMPRNEAEQESYQELFTMEIPKKDDSPKAKSK